MKRHLSNLIKMGGGGVFCPQFVVTNVPFILNFISGNVMDNSEKGNV